MGGTERVAVVVGRGGQGTKLGTSLLAWAGALEGASPMHYSVYDGLIRGGNIASTVVLADQDPGTVIRSRFDVMFAVHKGWFDRYYPAIGPGGVLFLDPAFVPEAWLTRDDVRHVPVDLTAVAREAGDARAVNMVAVGVLAGHWGMPGLGSLEAAVRDVTPPHRQDRVAANLSAIRAGWDLAAQGGDG